MYDLAPVQIAYANWLSEFKWQWFCTLTFREPPHPETADKRFRYWVHRINQKLYGKKYRKRGKGGIYWVLALEYHKTGVIHFHALLGDNEDMNNRYRRVDAKREWEELAGFARVHPITDRMSAVTNYVSKYVTKGGEITPSETLASYAEQLGALDRHGRASDGPVTVMGTIAV